MYFYPYDHMGDGFHQEHWDDDLERRFPTVYGRVFPWVNYYCCDMEMKHGYDHEPTREELREMSENIYDRIKDDLDDLYGDDHDHDDRYRDDERIPQYYGRRGALNDLIGIVLLQELLGRRDHRMGRRRRRRRRPHYGY